MTIVPNIYAASYTYVISGTISPQQAKAVPGQDLIDAGIWNGYLINIARNGEVYKKKLEVDGNGNYKVAVESWWFDESPGNCAFIVILGGQSYDDAIADLPEERLNASMGKSLGGSAYTGKIYGFSGPHLEMNRGSGSDRYSDVINKLKQMCQ